MSSEGEEHGSLVAKRVNKGVRMYGASGRETMIFRRSYANMSSFHWERLVTFTEMIG
jgi:hypothetical protein